MTKIRFPFFALLAGLGLLGSWHCQNSHANTLATAYSPNVTTESEAAMASFLEDFDQFFAQKMGETGTPGASVVIVKDNAVVFSKGYGKRELGGSVPVDENTVFRIGSLSKGFAAVLTGILVGEKKLAWDDQVVRWFPDFRLNNPDQTQRIRLTHLLSHTTGLPYQAYTSLIERNYPLREMAAWLPKAKLYAREGEQFRYQNLAFSIIEEVMYSAVGKGYNELLAEKILGPAGMNSTSCTFSAMQSADNKALPYKQYRVGRRRHRITTWRSPGISPTYYNVCPAGGVNASALDMGQWLKVLLGNRPDIVSKKTLDDVFTPRIETGDEHRTFHGWSQPKRISYALGWRVLESATDTLVYHGGFVNGYKSEICFDRKRQLGICILTNAPTGLTSPSVTAFFELYRSRFAENKGN